jgi:hypothetical protein
MWWYGLIEPSNSINCWEVLEKLSDWQLLKKDSAPGSHLISYKYDLSHMNIFRLRVQAVALGEN